MLKKYEGNQVYGASITVYLSLVLILILSLLMVVIEGARQTTARVFAERAFTTSMDSVLAGFYGPLMEEYHLLGLDCSYGEAICNDEEITSRMKDYMSYTYMPKQNLNGAQSRLELYGISLDSVDIKGKTSLMDYQGELFTYEITEYMKYREIGNVVEYLLDKVSVLKQPQKVSYLYDEKLKVEEQLVVIDEGILALMKHLDGISTNKKGVIRNKNGSLKTKDNFVKKILYETPTMENAGINNEAVFLALQNQYVDPSVIFTTIESNITRIIEINDLLVQLENTLQEISIAIEGASESLQQLNETLSSMKDDAKANTKDIEKNIKDAEDGISDLSDKADSIRNNIESYKTEKKSCIDTIISNRIDIYSITSECMKATEEAISRLEKIIKVAEECEPLIVSYEETLDTEKEGLNEDIFESLSEGLVELKRYKPDNMNGYDFILMKETLNKDYEVLIDCISYLDRGRIDVLQEDFISAKGSYNSAANKLMSYQTTGLNIDYSTLVMQDKETSNVIDGIKELIDEGILSLVIDPDTISDKELIEERLPSTLAALSEGKGEFSFSSLLGNMKIGGKDSGTGDLFDGFGDFSLGALIGDTANEMAERILIQEYINEQFYKFSGGSGNIKENKPSALMYEKEYLLCGKGKDKDNLEAIIIRIILLRTLLNFTTILTDKGKRAEAKTMASALVGFTGLPILVSITQSVLMILLAIMSALVDTCALLMGKELPILKKKIELNYTDLLVVSRDTIQKKASSYKDDSGFSYNDYLTLFLYITDKKDLTYRMMDMVQENINLRYGTQFAMSNCLFGYEAEAKFKIKPLFTTLSFMQKYITGDINKPFVVNAQYSY